MAFGFRNDIKDPVTLVPAGEIRSKRAIHTPIICGIMFLLMILGVVNLYSAGSGSTLYLAQIKHLGFGLVAFGICGWVIHPRIWNTYAYWIFGIVCVMLVVVLLIGRVGGGSQRWLHIGPFSGQPSELAKLAIVFVVGRFFYSNRQKKPYNFKDLIPVLLMISAVLLLIFPQPDFGTAGFCLLVALCQLAFIRIDKKTIFTALVLVAIALPTLWFTALEDYQKNRVLTFLNPDADPHGKGYNALQSVIAIGSGGLTGKGYLQGTQTQLQFLPMTHTDFVFSTFAEEHGFLAGCILFGLFGALCYMGLEIARGSKDPFNTLLAIGLTSFLFFEFFINIAMVLRMFPVVGLPLPFFTYGGSILVTVCSALGILVAIDRFNYGLTGKHHFGRRSS